MQNFNYCAACLVTGVRMHGFDSVISSTTISQTFLKLLRIPLIINTEENIYFCFECAALLHKFLKFTLKCHRAQDFLQDNCKATNQILINENRKKYKLTSTLSVFPTEYITINNNLCDNNILNVSEENLDHINPNKDCNISNNVNLELVKNEVQNTENEVNDTEKVLINTENLLNVLDEQENDVNDADNYYNNVTERNLTPKEHKRKTSKKEHKSKKRKKDIVLTKYVFESVSDDEPLANKVSITVNNETENNGIVTKNIRQNFDASYFEEYATVVFLTPDEAKNELLLRKESGNFINSPFKCELCYRGYESKTTFENHMKKHSSDYGEFKCDICHLRFPEQRCLCKHRLASHKRKFCCKLCPYICFCTHQAKTHVSFHKGKTYPCKECGEIFSMPNSLLMHKRLKHVTQCVCALCGDTFATPRGLYSHNMKVHRQVQNDKLGPICDECGIHFATEEAWKRHLVMSSKHNVSNGCKNCGDTFSNTEELKSHMRVHARKHANRNELFKLPSSCTICDKYLRDPVEYKSHMTSTHPQSDAAKRLDAELTPFVCELCGLAFKKQCFLKYHQRKHTGERPYKCIECNKTFQLSGALATHRAVHVRGSGHKCRVCERVFTFKSALNKHMKVHLNIRPHRCDICDKSFISPCDVRLHIKYVHNKVPWPKRDRTKRTQETNNFAAY